MERLSKIAIYLGMGIAITVFSLFLLSIVPHLVDQFDREWGMNSISEEEVLEKLQRTDSFQTFIEKYPDHGVYFDPNRNGGRLTLTAMNFETFNQLNLELRYSVNDGYRELREDVSCSNNLKNFDYRIRGTLASQFIEKVNCLDGDGLVSATSPLVDENGFPVPIKEPHGEMVYDYACGDNTSLDNGICIVD